MDRSVIERYAEGAGALARALEGLSAGELDAVPVPGTWSIRQIAVHLMESDLIGTDRMKRVAAENRPLLIGYDESAFIARLRPELVEPREAAELFRLNRVLTARLLRALPDEDFARAGVHNEKGKVTLGDLVRTYVDHLEGHLVHLREKRRLLGKPLG